MYLFLSSKFFIFDFYVKIDDQFFQFKIPRKFEPTLFKLGKKEYQ